MEEYHPYGQAYDWGTVFHKLNFQFFISIFQIMSELQSNGVQIYQFPVDDETVAETNSSMNVSYFINL